MYKEDFALMKETRKKREEDKHKLSGQVLYNVRHRQMLHDEKDLYKEDFAIMREKRKQRDIDNDNSANEDELSGNMLYSVRHRQMLHDEKDWYKEDFAIMRERRRKRGCDVAQKDQELEGKAVPDQSYGGDKDIN